jgi:hypothetical protein
VTDLALARLAAAAYDPAPAGTILDWRDCRVVLTGNVASVRGTVPDNWENWLRDFRVAGEVARDHTGLGSCPAGALDAAEALARALPATIDTLTGHSLGGQIAVLIAGLLAASGRVVRLVSWDAPKAGGNALAALLGSAEVRQYRFRGSYVTDWPAFLDRHVREPLIETGAWTPWPIEAHSISRYVGWLALQPPPTQPS